MNKLEPVINLQFTPTQVRLAGEHRARVNKLSSAQTHKPKTRELKSRTYAPLQNSVFSEAWKILNETVTIDSIKDAVCEHFGAPKIVMTHSGRAMKMYIPRAIAIYLCRRLTPHSSLVLGRHFGDRDHVTILHAANHITKLIEEHHPLENDVREISRNLGTA